MERAWEAIATRAWALLRDDALDFVVRPSLPILYFGDLVAYEASPRRVLTVGLNPSRHEFPAADPFRRFPRGRHLRPRDTALLRAALNAYFREAPYTSWFGSYEPLLHGLAASYYPGRASTALHTDLFSPIATDPTWSKLTPEQRAPLEREGVELWHDLVALLRPDVIVLSVARAHLARLRLSCDGPWRPLTELTEGRKGPRKKPYVVEYRRTDGPVLVFGAAAQRPFGKVSAPDREVIGRRLAALLD